MLSQLQAFMDSCERTLVRVCSRGRAHCARPYTSVIGTSIILWLALFCGLVFEPATADEDNESVRRSPYRESVTTNEKPPPTLKEKPAGKKKEYSEEQLEKHLFELINKDRAKVDAPALKLNDVLTKMAKDHANDMAKNDFFSHTGSDGMNTQARAKRAGITGGVSENLGNQTGDESLMEMVDDLEKTFLSEPDTPGTHRHILLNPTHTCVGVAVTKIKDGIVLVQDFTDVEPQ